MFSFLRRAGGIAAALSLICAAAPAQAYLYWTMPDFTGAPVKGDEPGIGLAMPGATSKELQAHLLWNLRAGLNVGALQCQFAPALMTVSNYNAMLYNHGKELTDAYNVLTAYFKRTQAKTWQKSLDQYTTRTYNGFSTLHAQRGFCEVSGQIGRDVLGAAKGKLIQVAQNRMREYRNSLVAQADPTFRMRSGLAIAPMSFECSDRKGRPIPCKA